MALIRFKNDLGIHSVKGYLMVYHIILHGELRDINCLAILSCKDFVYVEFYDLPF